VSGQHLLQKLITVRGRKLPVLAFRPLSRVVALLRDGKLIGGHRLHLSGFNPQLKFASCRQQLATPPQFLRIRNFVPRSPPGVFESKHALNPETVFR
jgi:hypothetical protein